MFETLFTLLLAGTLGTSAPMSNLASSFDESQLLHVSQLPYQEVESLNPYMSANSVLAIDLDSQATLYENNANAVVPIASLTKLMTAYIALTENDPNGIVKVSANAAGTIGSRMGLYTNEEITVKNLLFGLLIRSGNDAAVALAEHNAGSVSNFVEKMNQKAAELGLENTVYKNPTGLDSSGAHSSARDLSILSTRLLKFSSIQEIVGIQKTSVSSQSGHAHELTNTNILLGQNGIKGLKTGKTLAAGECLISFAESPDGHEIITIVLGSANRFTDTKALVDWIYNSFAW